MSDRRVFPASGGVALGQDEIQRFKTLGRSDRIFAIIVDGEPNAAKRGRDASRSVPRGSPRRC